MSGTDARKPQQIGLSSRFCLRGCSYDFCRPFVPGLKKSQNGRAMAPDEFGCIADFAAMI